MKREIVSVSLDMLREGPPHNQLLSPLTRYLARCGDVKADAVSVPYEHREFIRRLSALRYAGGAGADDRDRKGILEETGRAMANLLGRVPGLVTTLIRADAAENPLVHLQLVLAPSELAMLPFELSTVPQGASASEQDWLVLQTLVPVTMTRRLPGMSGEHVHWPRQPRILFAWSETGGAVNHAEHLDALKDALDPWRRPENGWDHVLTVVQNASLDAMRAALEERPHTHVHILAHGKQQDDDGGKSFELALNRAGSARSEEVNGRQLASALCPVTRPRIQWPAVVTLASCDSANVGTVYDRTGASIAHDLHYAGIPLVVASQFPLTQKGSVFVARCFYKDILAGDDPRISLQNLRTLLAANSDHWHDWASLVAYAALPPDLEHQLEEVRYRAARQADDSAFEFVDHAIRHSKDDPQTWARVEQRVRDAIQRYPTSGEFLAEGYGMRGSGTKRLAQAQFQLAEAGVQPDVNLANCVDNLNEAARHYWSAAEIYLAPVAERIQRLASLHWVLTQWLSLQAVLGRRIRKDLWITAKVSAEMELERVPGSEQVWALGSLAELALLQLTLPEDGREPDEDWAKKALKKARRIVKQDRAPDSFPVFSTRRGFDRYVNWWSNPQFLDELTRRGIERPVDWLAAGGVRDTAVRITQALQP